MTDEELAAAAKEQEALDAANAAKEAEAKAKSGETPKEKEDKKSGLTDTEAKALKELMAWKTKAREAEKEKAELEAKYGGIDLDAAKAALKAAEEAETKELEKKGEYDRLLAKQRDAAEARIEAERLAKEEAVKRISQLEQTVNKLALGNSFANSKYISENLALTPNKTEVLYASHFEIEDGKVIAYDAPKGAANRTPIVDARGEPVPFDEALAAIINTDPDKDYLLKSNLKSGAGSKAPVDTGKEKTPTYSSSLDKLAAGVKNPKNFGYGNK
jgi:hypothetical protein